MDKIRCIIVDDESLALNVLEEYISRLNNMELLARCSNAIEALNIINSQRPDLVFLDIQMPGLSGIELARSLRNQTKVIFTTAYHDFAVEGFDLEAVDYLLKPVSFERFMRAVEKFSNLYGHKPAPSNLETRTTGQPYNEAFIYLRADKKMVKVFLHQILFLESQKNYTRVVTSEREIISHLTITALEEKLPASKFLRIHRSFIVALDKIEAFSSTHIQTGRHELPIGRNYKETVESVLNYNL